MKIIQNNPYRIAGILSNATAKELQKQKGKIKAFSKVGKEITSEFDFDFLNSIERTEQNIEKAFSNIEQNQDKVNNSLFWFLKASPFDETAISYLIKGDSEKAKEIWGKVTNGKEVNSINFSAFNNIGTLKLLSKSEFEIKEGIAAKIKLIESDYFENFVHTVADQTFTIDNRKQSQKLIDELLKQFKNQYSSADALDLFSNCNGTTQKYISKKFTEEPMHNIESNIESTKRKRQGDKSDAYSFGLKLFVNAKDDLSLLKSLLGTSDLKYKMIADNLAKEVMQCGIDYFKEWKDSIDPSKDSLKLLKYAKSIAVGSQTKDRVKENIEGIEEWAVTAPIQKELSYIMRELNEFNKWEPSTSKAKELVVNCKPKLMKMRETLGSRDDFYLQISSAIVNNAQGAIIAKINEVTEKLGELSHGLGIEFLLPTIKPIFEEALEVSNMLGTLDMKSELKSHYNKNHNTLKSLASQMGIGTSTRTSSSSSSSDFEFSDNAWWIFAVAGIIIGLMMGFGWGSLITGVMGLWTAVKIFG